MAGDQLLAQCFIQHHHTRPTLFQQLATRSATDTHSLTTMARWITVIAALGALFRGKWEASGTDSGTAAANSAYGALAPRELIDKRWDNGGDAAPLWGGGGPVLADVKQTSKFWAWARIALRCGRCTSPSADPG